MKFPLLLTVVLFLLSSIVPAQDAAPTCADLNWSAQVLAANPDIAQSCQGVYERKGILYAKASIELVRIRGNSLTFRTLRTDGTAGKARRITVPQNWRANIGGRTYRANELRRGQQLSIYIPEDRFALVLHGSTFDTDDDMLSIEEADVVTMPRATSER